MWMPLPMPDARDLRRRMWVYVMVTTNVIVLGVHIHSTLMAGIGRPCDVLEGGIAVVFMMSSVFWHDDDVGGAVLLLLSPPPALSKFTPAPLYCCKCNQVWLVENSCTYSILCRGIDVRGDLQFGKVRSHWMSSWSWASNLSRPTYRGRPSCSSASSNSSVQVIICTILVCCTSVVSSSEVKTSLIHNVLQAHTLFESNCSAQIKRKQWERAYSEKARDGTSHCHALH